MRSIQLAVDRTIAVALLTSTGVASSAKSRRCAVTIPNGNTPPGEIPTPTHYGNGALWTVLSADGKVIVDESPDSMSVKFPWWRGVRGKLTIVGRRLDAPAPALRASIPEGYGDSGFQASGVTFPTEGCWEVTGKVGHSTLKFVTLVIREGKRK